MEYELLVIIGLSSGLCFVIGSWFSPLVRTLKKEVQYWRGVAGKYKAEANDSKPVKENLFGDSALGKMAEPIIQDILKDPTKLQGILDKLGVNTGGKPDDRPSWR